MSREAEGPAEAVRKAYRRAMTHLLAGRSTAALGSLARCLTLDPSFAPAFSTRAAIHVQHGRYEEARRDIERALALRPGHIGDLHNRAVVRTALELYDGAIQDYEAVLARDPGSAGTWNNLAWLLATARDPRVRNGVRALASAREAVRTDRQPAWLDTLAAAHAECGDFARAVAVEEEAWRRSIPPNERFRMRLELYRQGRTVAEWRAAHDGACK
jgi:Tfp pilus assembly protein PilF